MNRDIYFMKMPDGSTEYYEFDIGSEIDPKTLACRLTYTVKTKTVEGPKSNVQSPESETNESR